MSLNGEKLELTGGGGGGGGDDYNYGQLLGPVIVQELCESRGGRPGLSVLTSLLVSVDVKAILNHASAVVSACP